MDKSKIDKGTVVFVGRRKIVGERKPILSDKKETPKKDTTTKPE